MEKKLSLHVTFSALMSNLYFASMNIYAESNLLQNLLNFTIYKSHVFLKYNVIPILFYFLKVDENKTLSRTFIPRYCKALKYLIYVNCDQCL